MPDYSSYSMDALERMYEFISKANMELECQEPCIKCCIRIDCDRLQQVQNNIYNEIRKRRLKGAFHGEEKENQP
jgi:hypothetical protein